MQIPGNFVRQIARPDDDQLRIGEISPNHRERQKNVSQLVKAFFANDFMQCGARAKPAHQDDDQRQRAQHLAHAHQERKNR